jgi:hypothetical protein
VLNAKPCTYVYVALSLLLQLYIVHVTSVFQIHIIIYSYLYFDKDVRCTNKLTSLEKREKGMEVLLKKSGVPRRKPLALAKTERHAWSEGTTSPDPWADCALQEKSQPGGHP